MAKMKCFFQAGRNNSCKLW